MFRRCMYHNLRSVALIQTSMPREARIGLCSGLHLSHRSSGSEAARRHTFIRPTTTRLTRPSAPDRVVAYGVPQASRWKLHSSDPIGGSLAMFTRHAVV